MESYAGADLPPLPDDFTVPDYIEAVVGWRIWRTTGWPSEPILVGLFKNVLWPLRAALIAECDKHGDSAPVFECTCGIHALKWWRATEFRSALFNRPRDPYLVVGEVFLWGEAIEHDLGWRAANAYPKAVAVVVLDPLGNVRDAISVATRLSARYAIPTRVARRWEFL